jgi:AraC-like DNA-binding protein
MDYQFELMQQRFPRVDDGLAGWPRPVYVNRYRACAPGYRNDRFQRFPGHAVLMCCLEGALAVDDDGTKRILRPGAALLSRHEERNPVYHLDHALAPCFGAIGLIFTGDAALAMVDGLVAAHGRVIPCPAEHAALRRILTLTRSRRWNPILPQPQAAALVMDALTAMAVAAAARRTRGDRIAETAAALLAENPNRRVSDIARQLRVSREHLIRAFRAAHGRTPHRWALERRLDEACRRLATGGSVSAAATAAQLSLAAFHRAFARRHGMTPAVYRKLGG